MVLCLVFTTAEVTKFTQSNKDFQKVERERKNGTHVKKTKKQTKCLAGKMGTQICVYFFSVLTEVGSSVPALITNSKIWGS